MTNARWFNDVLGAYAILAADDLNWLSVFEQNSISRGKLEGTPVQVRDALLRALSEVQVVEVDHQGMVHPGAALPAARNLVGLFRWLSRGNGALLATVRGPLKDSHALRDPVEIGLAGGEYGAAYVDPIVLPILSEAQVGVVDLGCGSASRLIALLRERRDLRGLAVDRSARALSLACEEASRAGVSKRLTLVCADVATYVPPKNSPHYDVLVSCFVAHELFSEGRLASALDHLADAYPSAQSLVLVDTVHGRYPVGNAPEFVLGFELVHTLLGERIPTHAQLLEEIGTSRWRLSESEEAAGLPGSLLFRLTPCWDIHCPYPGV